MKLLILFYFLGLIAVSASTYSQQTKFTQNFDDVTVKEVFKRIEGNSNFVLFYDEDIVDVDRKVDLEVKNRSVEYILNEIFKGTNNSYKIYDRQIVITTKEKEKVSSLESLMIDQPQKKTVSGRVTDASGAPLPGVSIVEKETKHGIVTDNDGNYTLVLSGSSGILQFSFIGMKTREVALGGKTQLNVILYEDVKALDEVVAIGYQTAHKRDLTSSVTSISAEKLSSVPVASISALLAGQAAGVQSVISSGAPGARGSVVIRGNSSMSGQLDPNTAYSNPLYVVDGVPTSLSDLAGYDMSNTDFLASLNPDDIESIDILKDASAAAIYGSRGANGVIIINTKKGKAGKTEFNVNVYKGITVKPQLLKVLVGSAERNKKLELINKWWKFQDMASMLPLMLTDSLNPSFNNNNDYQGLFYQPGQVESYDMNMTGGTENSNYRIGLGYYSEKGIIRATGFDRYTLSLNQNTKVNKAFENQMTINISATDNKNGLGGANPRNNLPVSPLYMNSSLFQLPDNQRDALLGQMDDLYNKNRNLEVRLSNFAQLNLVNGLTLNSQIGLTHWQNKVNYFQPAIIRSDKLGYADYAYSMRQSAIVETYFSYNKKLKELHNFSFLLGNSIEYNQYESMDISAVGGSGDAIKVLKGYSKESIDGYSDISSNSMLSYWSRLGYQFKDRYMIDLNYRRDASSRFGKDVRWGNFPSLALGWIISDESWIKEKTGSWLNFAKLKLSWGINGKQFDDNFLRYNSYTNYGMGIWSNQMSVNTYNGVIASGPDFSKIANDKLSWEQSTQWNIGTELDMLDRRLTVTFDAYKKSTDHLLFDVSFPKYSGYNTAKANVAGVLNYGYEFRVLGKIFPTTNAFRWDLELNLSNNWNYVSKLPNGNRDFVNDIAHYGYTVGMPINQYWLFQMDKIIDDIAKDVPVNPYTGQPYVASGAWAPLEPGLPLWKDLNKDYQLDGDLKNISKYSPNPKVQGALNSTMMYKGWVLNVNTQFIIGRDIYNRTLHEYLRKFDFAGSWEGSGLIDLSAYSFWEKPGDAAAGVRFPSLRPLGGNTWPYYQYDVPSDMWIENGSYFKIQSATLAYNFNENKFIKSLLLKRLRLYLTAYNIWQWQKSTVSDASMVDAAGYDYGDGYPQPRKYIVGINFRF